MSNYVRLSAMEIENLSNISVSICRLKSFHMDENNLAKALDLTVRLKYLTNLVKNIKLKVKNADSRDL